VEKKPNIGFFAIDVHEVKFVVMMKVALLDEEPSEVDRGDWIEHARLTRYASMLRGALGLTYGHGRDIRLAIIAN
jgi:hypothetical protein